MTVTTRRDRRDQQRRKQQRHRGGGGGGPSPRGIGQMWIAAGVIVGFIVLVLAARALGVFEPPAAKVDPNSKEFDTAGQTVGTKIEDLGNAHIPTGQKATYNSVPPTSGEHWAQPAAPTPWGIKDAVLPNEVTTHNLEHGGVVIAYNNLSKDETDQLKNLVKQLTSGGFPKIVLEPYPDLKDSKVALTAWTWIYKLPTVDQTQIIRFLRAHYDLNGEAPEKGIG